MITSRKSPSLFNNDLQRETLKLYGPPPSHVIAADKQADQYWHLHRSDCRNTLTYTYTASRTVPTFDVSLGTLTLPTPEVGDFLELILLHRNFTGRRDESHSCRIYH